MKVFALQWRLSILKRLISFLLLTTFGIDDDFEYGTDSQTPVSPLKRQRKCNRQLFMVRFSNVEREYLLTTIIWWKTEQMSFNKFRRKNEYRKRLISDISLRRSGRLWKYFDVSVKRTELRLAGQNYQQKECGKMLTWKRRHGRDKWCSPHQHVHQRTN